MNAKMMSILRQSRSFENRMYGYMLEDLPSDHRLNKISLMQLKIIFEIYRSEAIGLRELSDSVSLPRAILRSQLAVLEEQGLTISVSTLGQTVYCIPEESISLLEPLDERLNRFVDQLGFRVGEMVLTEWDHILKIVNNEFKHITTEQVRPSIQAREVLLR